MTTSGQNQPCHAVWITSENEELFSGRSAHSIAAVRNEPTHAGTTASQRTDVSLTARVSLRTLATTDAVNNTTIGARIRLPGGCESVLNSLQVKIDSLMRVTSSSTHNQTTAVS